MIIIAQSTLVIFIRLKFSRIWPIFYYYCAIYQLCSLIPDYSTYDCLKGLFTNFEYITFCRVSTNKNFFNYIQYIKQYSVGLTLSTYFLNYFESEWFYQDEPFIKNVSSIGARKKMLYIQTLVNNPFKWVKN